MSSNGYENMLEKYRDVDEDEIMSGLTKDELARLENEIDREILEKTPEYGSYESDSYTSASTTSDDDSEYEEQCKKEVEPIAEEVEEIQEEPRSHPQTRSKPEAFTKGKLDKTQLKPVQRFLPRQKSKDKHSFKLPALKSVSGKAGGKNTGTGADESKNELKDELIQAVKKRDKRRTRRASSYLGGGRRPSVGAPRARRNSKITRYRDGNEHQLDAAVVNKNCITNEMLNLRPKLRKVQIKEPKLVLPEELHGVSFNRITAGAKHDEDDDEPIEEEAEAEPEPAISEDGNASRSSAFGYDADNDVTPSLSDESYALPGDGHDRKQTKRHQALSESSEAPSDGVMTMASTTSTSADSCDIFGELSINPNSVEEMVERVRENDPMLTEVNLNNIHDVPIERFEELAEAMEDNCHVTSLSLANTGLTDRAAKALASMLKKNKTLKKINIESNFLTGDGARRIVSALRKNHNIIELSFDNQRHIFGAKVEMEISKLLRENTSLLKFGYQFANAGPRMATSNILTKNMDIIRKKRVAEEKKRQHAGLPKRPPLRRQPSSEWYRKERLERLKKLQQQSKLLGMDPSGNMGEKDVEKVLKNMNPEEVSLLERWFTSKLLGMVDKPPEESAEKHIASTEKPQDEDSQTKHIEKLNTKSSDIKSNDNLLRPPPRARRSRSPVANRDDLMDSIRKQNARLKKVKLRPFESPSRLGNSDSDVEVKPLQKNSNKPQENIGNNQPTTQIGQKTEEHTQKQPSPVPEDKQQEKRDLFQPSNSAPQKHSAKTKCVESSPDKDDMECNVVVKPAIMKTEPSFDNSLNDKARRTTSGEDFNTQETNSGNESNHMSLKSEESGRDDSSQPSCSSPEVHEWKEGEEYDSDEYEVVEIEVTDSEDMDEGETAEKEAECDVETPSSHDSSNSPAVRNASPSRYTKNRSDKFADTRPPPFTGSWNQRSRSPQTHSPISSASLRSNTRSPLSPPTARSPISRSPLSPSTPRSSATRSPLSPSTPRSTSSPLSPHTPRTGATSSPFGAPTYNRSLSRNSNASTGSSSPRYSRPTPSRSSRTADEDANICPKARSTIESFFAFK